MIVTEPRRVAALSLAHFLAARLGQKVGHEVGFQVRFERWPGTRLTFMTPGVFLAHLRMRREIPGVDVVVVDEFHERDALTDAVLALLREQRRQGRLRVVVMSATLEASRVASYLDAIHIDFGASSVRESPDGEVLNNGRYEVHILYRPNADLPQILREISEKEEKKDPRFPGGGTLVFLPGKREIEEAARQVRAAWPEAVILPLHSECSEEEIRAALNPPQGRRWVVLATNVAETSLTIPDVRYVVDTGVEKVQVWDPRTGAGSLRPVPISRSSAAQRAGRAGRTGPGVVFRMWSREDHARRPEFRPPEILREDLGHLTLQLLDMGIRPSSLEWLD
ncbi:MAG: helicase-related protein, partial [Anaerolineae bacterium]|nr:helicase-related protein [Anaerolineae bacterium]